MTLPLSCAHFPPSDPGQFVLSAAGCWAMPVGLHHPPGAPRQADVLYLWILPGGIRIQVSGTAPPWTDHLLAAWTEQASDSPRRVDVPLHRLPLLPLLSFPTNLNSENTHMLKFGCPLGLPKSKFRRCEPFVLPGNFVSPMNYLVFNPLYLFVCLFVYYFKNTFY